MSTKKRFESRGYSSFKSKQAQITIFMIIGIVILFLFLGIFYLTQNSIKEQFTEAGDPVIKAIPTLFQPIQAYTEGCLTRVTERALKILGEQGGYINPDLIGKYSSTDPSNADGIDLGGSKIPYWLYNIEDNRVNKIQFASLRPELHKEDDPENSVEVQIARYVDEKLEECLQNFEVFHQQGFIVSHEVPSTEIKITDTTVNALLSMKVTASNIDSNSEFTKTLIKIPLALKRYYLAAEEITKLQKNVSFLEQQAMELIQIFSAPKLNKLPPTFATGFELIPSVSWNVIDVNNNIKTMLTSYVPMVRFIETSDFVRYQYPLSNLQGLYQRTYDNSALPLESVKGLDVNFDYIPSWEPYVKINDKDGIVKPQHLAVHDLGLHQGFQTYRTVYDLSYPVMVTIIDDEAFNGEGYNFVFALESNVRKNAPAEDGQDLLPPRSSLLLSLACNPDQFNTQPLRTLVVDSYTKDPLEFVTIGFKIPNADNCDIGKTNKEGQLTSKYPAVYGGVINFIKEDYLSNQYGIDTYKFKKQSTIIGYSVQNFNPNIIIPLHKIKSINITVKKKHIDKCIDKKCFFSGIFGSGGTEVYSFEPTASDSQHQWFFTGISKQMDSFDEAFISLKRVSDLYINSNNEDFTATIQVKGTDAQEVDLVPGVYEVTVVLMKNEPVVIPAETRCDGTCFEMPETVMEQMIIGQLKWNTKKTYLTITPEQLYSSSELQFQIPAINIDAVPEEAGIRVLEDLELTGKLASISRDLRTSIPPLFK